MMRNTMMPCLSSGILPFSRLLLLTILLLTACGQDTSTPPVYRGITLPPPQPRTGLPPAWLVIDAQAVAGTRGSYTLERDLGNGHMMAEHGDAAPPQLLSNLATVTVPAGAQPEIVVGATPVSSFGARIGAWTAEPMPLFDPSVTQPLGGTSKPTEGVSLFVLDPVDGSDQILVVSFTFDRGNVDYFWRLNPNQ